MWESGDAYGRFMGRWSALVAEKFLERVDVPDGRAWLDVGCGTGELLGAVVASRHPHRVVGVDDSPAFIAGARQRWRSADVVSLDVGSAEALPYPDATFDGVVSGLALNFVPDQQRGLAEMARVTRRGGTVALYVWDYDYPDFFLTRLWVAAERVTGRGLAGDERSRWPVCSEDGLQRLINEAALDNTSVFPLRIETAFLDADELFDGFLLGVGPAGALVSTLDAVQKACLRAALEEHLPVSADGSIHLSAQAWAVTATRTSGRMSVPRPPDAVV